MNRSKRKDIKFKQKKKKEVPEVTIGAPKTMPRPQVHIEPMNDKQRDYLYSLFSSPCVVCEGPAGVGKTYLAASVAAKDLAERRVDRIILSRANVSTGKSLGSFPGTVEEKMAPWLLPITDVLRGQLGNSFYDLAVKRGQIEVQPIETIRGRSFDDSICLFDEAQQLTKDELKAITTRIGQRSKLFLMGDAAQRDTHADGLEWLRNLVYTYSLPIDFHKFTSDDCVRSDLCGLLIKAFEQEALR